MRSGKFAIDYRKICVTFDSSKAKFEYLPSECVAILKSVVELPVGVPFRVKAELSGNHCGLFCLGSVSW